MLHPEGPIILLIIIIEHLPEQNSLIMQQSTCRFALIGMIINRHIKSNMIKT